MLPWHDASWQRVTQLEDAGRLPHALLLCGASGLGKRSFATRLLDWLLCDQHRGRTAPCGRCRGCTLAAAGSHPDLSRLLPDEDKTTIGIDRVRALIDYVQLTPSHCDRKLVLVENADDLGVPAANNLLKVLEEPPGAVVFVLVADRPAALPVTLRSRCQQIRFRRPATDVAAAWLAEQGTDADAGTLLELAAGAPLRARELGRSDAMTVLGGVRDDVSRLMARALDPVRTAQRWSKLTPQQTVTAVHAAVAGEIRRHMLSDSDHGRQITGQALDCRRLFDALDECARVRALVERRTLSPNEQIMVTQKLALACAMVDMRG